MTAFGRMALVLMLAAAMTQVAAKTARVRHDAVIGGSFLYAVRAGDSLALIGARFGVDIRLLAKDNALSLNARLRPGQTILVDNRHLAPEPAGGEELIVNVPQRMLFRYDDGEAAAAYPIAVGSRGWPTFTGPFEVMTLETDPTWDVPPSIQEEQRRTGKPVLSKVPPGPENPLGQFWIGLSRPGFGIHGTNAPSSIYSFRTHGCIRLHPEDVAALFSEARVGMRGLSIYEPILVAMDPQGVILLEVSPDPYQRGVPDGIAVVREWLEAHGLDGGGIDWPQVRLALRSRAGRPIAISSDAVLGR